MLPPGATVRAVLGSPVMLKAVDPVAAPDNVSVAPLRSARLSRFIADVTFRDGPVGEPVVPAAEPLMTEPLPTVRFTVVEFPGPVRASVPPCAMELVPSL